MVERGSVMSKKYNIITTINTYLSILKRPTVKRSIKNTTIELLRDTVKAFGIDPDETDDPAACRKYLRQSNDDTD